MIRVTQVVTSLVWAMFFLALATPTGTRAACFESQNANTFAAENEGINPSEGFSKTNEFSSVITARGGTGISSEGQHRT